MKKVLFLCHGNICRSPMAEFTMKQIASGEAWQIDSKAVSREEEGNPIDPRAARTLQRHGVPFTAHYAATVTAADCREYDFLIGMEARHLTALRASEGKLFRLLDFTAKPGDIEDPWYTGRFDYVWDQIHEGCLALYRYLKENP